jgi:hypothetical protein
MANDFSQDAGCKALWRFESGALTQDSQGSNTLTPVNSPGESLADYQEGACAVLLVRANQQCFSIPDADLEAGFPLKSGDLFKLISICGWVKPASSPGWMELFGKTSYTWSNGTCFGVHRNASGGLYIGWGHDGTNSDISTGISLSNGEWYHVAVVADGKNKTAYVRVYRVSNDTVYTQTLNPPGEMQLITGPFRIGAFADTTAYNFDGLIDEVVVFNRLLSIIEIDAIRTATFPPPPVVEVDALGAVALYELQAKVEVEAAGAVALYEPAAKAQVEAAGMVVLYSTVPDLLPPDNSACVSVSEDIPPALDKGESITTTEAITLPKPESGEIITTAANLAKSNPEDVICETESPGLPTYAGLFLVF